MNSIRLISISSIFFLLLASCHATSVYFDRPQPRKGIVLDKIPTELQGIWEDSNLLVNLTYVHNRSSITFSKIKIHVSDSTIFVYEADSNNVWDEPTVFRPSDTFIVQKCHEYYILNHKEKDTPWWKVVIVQVQNNGDIIWYRPNTPPFFGRGPGLRVKKIHQVFENEYTKDDELRSRKPWYKKSLNPGKKVQRIEAVYYSGQFRYKDIPQVLIPNNVFFLLKKNGSIEGTPGYSHLLEEEEIEEDATE